jgi:hypothetical protein
MKNVVVLLAGLAILACLQAQPVTGISGTVINAENRQPIVGATVCCYVANTHTDSAGAYLIGGLQPGKYRVRAIATGYETGYYPESVLVVQGQVTPEINFWLLRTGQTTGTIIGQVVAYPSGQVIVGASVKAANAHGYRLVVQSAQGYGIDSLPAGKYWVGADAAGFVPGNYPESVTVVAGQITDHIDFHLVPAGGQTGGISGHVTDVTNQQPIRGAMVTAAGPNGSGTAQTESCGRYQMEGLPVGRYRVCAQAEGYQPAVFPESVAVIGGQITPNINFALAPIGGQNGGISGRVTNSQNGQVISGAMVRIAGPQATRELTQGYDGYVENNLPPGRYWVSATAQGFQPGAFRESVTVVAGQITPNICFALVPTGGQNGAISGRVTNASNQLPIARAVVTASGPNGHGTAQTEGCGGYRIGELPAGKYCVRAEAQGFLGCTFPESVIVAAGQVRENVNFALEPIGGQTGAIIGLIVDDHTRQVINRAVVRATSGRITREALQSEQGYRIGDLPPGKYCVTASAEGYLPGHYPESVLVVAGQTTDHIDFALAPNGGQVGGISGFVTNARNQVPIRGALVVATGPGQGTANTCERGGYEIRNLEPGVYLVMACARGFQPSAWDTVEVVAGRTTEHVDFALEPMGGGAPGGITGVVRDSSQRGIPGAYVFASGPNGQGSAYADSLGEYEIRDLNPGAYLVRAHARGYYPATFPESVHVVSGQATPNINFVLRRVDDLDAGVGGFVFDGYTQNELELAKVTIIGANGSQDVYTDAWGDYVVNGLQPGEYAIEVSAAGYEPVVYPDLVVVESGAITAFISPAVYPLSGVAEPGPQSRRTEMSLRVGPNPFSGRALIQWQVRMPGRVAVRVFDNAGRTVRAIQNGELSTGFHAAIWDGTNDLGQKVANGIYFCRLDAADTSELTKVVLLNR